jgi:hypothetical protein
VSRSARESAFLDFRRRRLEGVDSDEEMYRLDSGFRIEHVREDFAEIYRGVRNQLDGVYSTDHVRQQWRNSGVILTDMKNLHLRPDVEQVIEHGEFPSVLNLEQSENTNQDVEEIHRKFPAEYIGFADFRMLEGDGLVESGQLPDLEEYEANAAYISQWEMDEMGADSWGIVIDLGALVEFQRTLENWDDESRNSCLIYTFFFHLFHEHFHYLTELVALELSPPDNRFELYRDYRKNAEWGPWFCNDHGCCKETINRSGKSFVQYVIEDKNIVCGEEEWGHGHAQAEIGWQYPLEETMANAYAVRMFNQLFSGFPGADQWLNSMKDWIGEWQPLGYTEYHHFPWRGAFRLGERMMTRLLRGDISPPNVNNLQHLLFEIEDYKKVEEEENRLFRGLDLTENGYRRHSWKTTAGDVPIYITNCDKYPSLAAAIIKFTGNW